jgi:hypothetical protein
MRRAKAEQISTRAGLLMSNPSSAGRGLKKASKPSDFFDSCRVRIWIAIECRTLYIYRRLKRQRQGKAAKQCEREGPSECQALMSI